MNPEMAKVVTERKTSHKANILEFKNWYDSENRITRKKALEQFSLLVGTKDWRYFAIKNSNKGSLIDNIENVIQKSI